VKQIGEQHVGILDELLVDEVETIKRGNDKCQDMGSWEGTMWTDMGKCGCS